MSNRARAALVGLVALGGVELWLAHRTALPGGIIERRYDLLVEVLAWWAVSAVALCLVFLVPRRTAVLVVLGLAVALRVASVSERAPMSDDLYRYAWDGVVQHAGVNPYKHNPREPKLSYLRDAQGSDWLWPDEWVGQQKDSRINRTNVRTIYPPVAEAWFFAVHAVVPLSAEDRGYEYTGLLVDLAVLSVLLALLRSRGRDPRWVAVYALLPLPVLEAVQNAHVDGLAVLLALVAVLLWPRRPPWAAAALAGAALVKIYPGALVVLLLRAKGTRTRVAGVFFGLCALAYLPHLVVNGTRLFGYLPGYLDEEQYDEGGRYLLLGLTGLSGAAASLVALLLLVVLVRALWRSDLPLERAAVVLLVGVFLLATPVQPWYALLLVALVAVTGQVWALPVAVAPYPLFFATILDGDGPTTGRLTYGLAACVVAVTYVRWRQQPQRVEVPSTALG